MGGRFAPSALAADLARTGGAAQAALAEAIDRHRGVLTLSPERPGDGATVTGAAAMTAMLLEAGKAVAAWLPHQHHLMLPEQFLADLEAGRPLTCRVHPEPLAGGCPAVMTHGLAALGGTEVLLRQEGASVSDLTARLEAMLGESGGIGAVPVTGQRSGGQVLRAATHPDHGTALLELVEG